MASSKKEFLVILDPSEGEEIYQRLRSRYEVAQSLPPHIVIQRLDADEIKRVETSPGVQAVCEGSPPADVLETLSPSEVLFVTAWVERQRSAHKKRRGEGLAWDAPGYQPPDAPQEE